MKKSFTLVELILAMALMSIVIIFLFQTLNLTQKSTIIIDKHIAEINNSNFIQEVITKDILELEKGKKVEYLKDKEDNHRIYLQTLHTMNNPFFTHITYLVTKEKNLVRIESKTNDFSKGSNLDKLEDAYIVPLLTNVEYFRISPINKSKNQFAVYIKSDNKEFLFTAISLLN